MVITAAGGEDFPAHRIILADCEPLNRLFSAGTADSAAPRLPEVDAGRLKLVLEWMYAGKCELDDVRKLPSLLETAHFLLIGSLQIAITCAMLERLDASACGRVDCREALRIGRPGARGESDSSRHDCRGSLSRASLGRRT